MAYPKIEICSPDGRAMYVTIDGYVFYIDNSTNEQIMDCWKESRCVNCGYDFDNVKEPVTPLQQDEQGDKQNGN